MLLEAAGILEAIAWIGGGLLKLGELVFKRFPEIKDDSNRHLKILTGIAAVLIILLMTVVLLT